MLISGKQEPVEIILVLPAVLVCRQACITIDINDGCLADCMWLSATDHSAQTIHGFRLTRVTLSKSVLLSHEINLMKKFLFR